MKEKKPFVYDEQTRLKGIKRADEIKLALARSAKRVEDYDAACKELVDNSDYIVDREEVVIEETA